MSHKSKDACSVILFYNEWTCCFAKIFSFPQISNSRNTGDRLFPSSVSEYSTRGGTSLWDSLMINPSFSSSFSCSASTFLDISGIRTAISPKRFLPDIRKYIMIVFHFPPISWRVAVTGQFVSLITFTILVTFMLLLFWGYWKVTDHKCKLLLFILRYLNNIISVYD